MSSWVAALRAATGRDAHQGAVPRVVLRDDFGLAGLARRAERGDLPGDVLANRFGRLKRQSVAVCGDGVLVAAALGEQRAAGDVQLWPAGRAPASAIAAVADSNSPSICMNSGVPGVGPAPGSP